MFSYDTTTAFDSAFDEFVTVKCGDWANAADKEAFWSNTFYAVTDEWGFVKEGCAVEEAYA